MSKANGGEGSTTAGLKAQPYEGGSSPSADISFQRSFREGPGPGFLSDISYEPSTFDRVFSTHPAQSQRRIHYGIHPVPAGKPCAAWR